MATAKQIRDVLVRCADGAVRDCPADLNERARMFAARLSGMMSAHGDFEIENALRRVLGLGTLSQPSDGA